LAHRLLAHLSKRGFEGAPRLLGTDEYGRDILTFIEGEVPADLSFHGDATLRAAARLIRRFHDLTAELVAPEAARPVWAEIVCHNDLSPCNFVFANCLPVAIIDFDAAAPGCRLHDLGYAAWLWLDLGSPDIAADEQKRRLAVFLDAYGNCDPGAVIRTVLKRQRMLVAEGARIGNSAMAQWASACMAWTRRHRDDLA